MLNVKQILNISKKTSLMENIYVCVLTVYELNQKWKNVHYHCDSFKMNNYVEGNYYN